MHEIESQNDRASVDLEDDDGSDDTLPAKPWDPSKIRVTTKHFSLRQVVDEITDGGIDLAPDFQRAYVWKNRQKTLLIESILIGIPLPAFYFNSNTENLHQVVDGVQRLSTIRDFANGVFPLSADLEYLRQLEGKRFAHLDPVLRRRFNQTQIVVHVIDAASPEDLKYDIFKRINTGGTPLKPQEIRHCMSQSRSREFLKRLAASAGFRASVPLNNPTYMEDRELVLRFVAFYRLSAQDPSFNRYPRNDTLDEFLLGAATDLDDVTKVTDAELAEIEQAFESAVKNASLVFGDQAFRKIRKEPNQRARMSRTLFESWTVALARAGYLSKEQASRIRGLANDAMMTDAEYVDSYTRATGNPERIRMRFSKARDIVERALRSGE